MIIMVTTDGFKISQMNFEAQDFRDEFAKFMQHCNLIFTGPYAKKTQKEQFFFILLWIGIHGVEVYNSWA